MMAEAAAGSRSSICSLKYLVRVLFPLPGFPCINNTQEALGFDHALYCACSQSHSNVPSDAFAILLKRVLTKQRLERHSVAY